MIKLTKLADYAVVLMSTMAEHPDKVHAAADVARGTHIPGPTAAKILGTMARAGLLTSHRGLKGGFSLAMAPQDITVADVIRAVDGPIALTDCVEHGTGDCDILDSCRVRGYWHKINGAVTAALESMTLAEISSPMPTYLGKEKNGSEGHLKAALRDQDYVPARETCPGAAFAGIEALAD